MSLVRLTPWQGAIASIGSRFRYMFVPSNRTTPITNATVAEAKRVLGMRPEVKVLGATLLGRILQVDIESRAARPLVALLGEWLVAGDPSVTFQALEVYSMSESGANPSTPQQPKAPIGQKEGEIIKSIGDRIHDFLVGTGQTVGETAGVTVASAIKPLFLYAILGFAAYTLINRKVQ